MLNIIILKDFKLIGCELIKVRNLLEQGVIVGFLMELFG